MRTRTSVFLVRCISLVGLTFVVLICATAAMAQCDSADANIPSWADFRTAEIRLSQVDDGMTVDVNGKRIDAAGFNETRPWVDVTEQLRKGKNIIHVRITNEKGDACSGRLEIRFNGKSSLSQCWYWQKDWAPSEKPCADEDVIIWLK